MAEAGYLIPGPKVLRYHNRCNRLCTRRGHRRCICVYSHITTANDYKLSMSPALDLAFYGRSVCWTLCMCSHSQTLLLFRVKESLAIYYLRSLCLRAFATLPAALCLCRKASCGLWTGFRAAAEFTKTSALLSTETSVPTS